MASQKELRRGESEKKANADRLTALAAGCGGGGGGGDLPPPTLPQLKLLAGAVGGAGNADGPAGIARFDQPSAVVVAADGSRYVAEARNHTIRRIAPDGTVSTLAGQSGTPGSADGMGTQISFNQPLGLALDDAGGLFVADSGNHTIRRLVLADGSVSTVAGKALQVGTTSGAGAVARFNTPVSLAFHGGLLFIADWGNHAIRVRDESGGGVSTIACSTAGQAGDAVATVFGTAARFRFPNGLAYRASDNTLFVIDGNNCVIRSVVLSSSGVAVEVVAGTIGNGSSGQSEQCGQKDSANPLQAKIHTVSNSSSLPQAIGISVDATGKVYFSQSKVRDTALRSLVVGERVDTLSVVGNGFANGNLSNAKFDGISGVVMEADGKSLLVADQGNNLFRRVDSVVVTEAGQSPPLSADVDGEGPRARFAHSPRGLHLRSDGSMLVGANALRQITSTGMVSTVANLTTAVQAVSEALNGLTFHTDLESLSGQRAGATEFQVKRFAGVVDPVRDGPGGGNKCPRSPYGLPASHGSG